MKSYALHRAGGGLLATHVALVQAGVAARPLLAIDTGSLYTIVEPKFIAAVGIDSTKPVDKDWTKTSFTDFFPCHSLRHV